MNLDNFVYTYLTPNNIIIILVLFLIVLSTIIIVLILTSLKERKNDNTSILTNDKNDFNINEVSKKLEENMNKERFISVNEYENEQEEKAIISYDELLRNASSLTINYEDEPSVDGVKVRKVEIEREEGKVKELPKSKNRSFYSYEREEEFLKALKQFRANL